MLLPPKIPCRVEPLICSWHKSVARWTTIMLLPPVGHRSEVSTQNHTFLEADWQLLRNCWVLVRALMTSRNSCATYIERLKKEQNHPFRVYNSKKAEHYNKRLINASNSSQLFIAQIFLTLITVFAVYIMVDLDLVVGKVFVKAFKHSLRKGCQGNINFVIVLVLISWRIIHLAENWMVRLPLL